MIWLTLAALAFVGALCVPVWVRLHVVFHQGQVQVKVLPWGRAWGSARILGWLSRKAEALLDRFLSSKSKTPEAPAPPEPTPTRGRTKRLPWRLVLWLAGRGVALIGALTRRLTIRASGWDPALMGFCQGVVTAAAAAFGTRKLHWESDFGLGSPCAELTWDVGSSLLGLAFWVGRNALRMPSKEASESTPRPTGISSLA